MTDLKKFFLHKYKEFKIPVPEKHFVLGSLFGKVFDKQKSQALFSEWELRGKINFSKTPGLSVASSPTHSGCYEYFYHKKIGKSLCIQSGRLHGYEGLSAKQVSQTVIGPRQAGTKYFVLSNISGALKKELSPGTILAVTDHINLTGQSPLVGLSREQPKSFYFLDMKGAYSPAMTKTFITLLKQQNLNPKCGVYVGLLGPQFETPAEVSFLAKAGGDIVGMSTVWEVMALHYLKTNIAVFSIVSNFACGIAESVEIEPSKLEPSIKGLIQAFLQFTPKKI